MDAKKISVIISVYNAADYLWENIESVYNQTFKNFEVIVIDDGSTDESLKVLYDILQKYPSMKVYTQYNQGPGATRNQGLQYATGKYIYFLDADDVICNTLFESCVDIMESSSCDIVGFQADIFGDIANKDKRQYIYTYRCKDMNQQIGGEKFFQRNHYKIPLLNIPLLFFKTDFLKQKKLKFMEGVFHEDIAFYYALIASNPLMYLNNAVLYHRRYRKNSIMTCESQEHAIKRIYDKIKIYQNILEQKNEKLIEVYMYDALKGIRYNLEKIAAMKLTYNEEIVACIKNTITILIRREIPSGLLLMCELYTIMRYLQIEDRMFNQMLESVLTRVDETCGCNQIENNIAIYGTGAVADLFLNVRAAVSGTSEANIVYLDTYIVSGTKLYRDKKIMNYKDVNYSNIKTVIIASECYDMEMKEALKNIKANCQIVSLKEL